MNISIFHSTYLALLLLFWEAVTWLEVLIFAMDLCIYVFIIAAISESSIPQVSQEDLVFQNWIVHILTSQI